MRRFADLVYRRLRLRNPWNYKAPLLISFTYYMMAVGRAPWDRALLGVLASLCTIAGIAGVAYFINDLTDARADLLAGKDNAVAVMSWPQRIVALTLFLAAALLPWLYLPLTRAGGSLLVAEFALFVLYCFPPFRLKERGLLGVVADATYAHALPAVLATLTFAEFATEPYPALPVYLAALGMWQLALGMRNIVLHQLVDYEKDRTGGNHTFAVAIGPDRLDAILKRVLVPLEIAAFVAFVAVTSSTLPWLAPAYGLYVLYAVGRLKLFGQGLPSTLREALYTYGDNFYADWLPLLLLGFMLARVPGCWPLAVLHVVALRNGLRQSWQDVRGHWLEPSRAAGRL